MRGKVSPANRPWHLHPGLWRLFTLWQVASEVSVSTEARSPVSEMWLEAGSAAQAPGAGFPQATSIPRVHLLSVGRKLLGHFLRW